MAFGNATRTSVDLRPQRDTKKSKKKCLNLVIGSIRVRVLNQAQPASRAAARPRRRLCDEAEMKESWALRIHIRSTSAYNKSAPIIRSHVLRKNTGLLGLGPLRNEAGAGGWMGGHEWQDKKKIDRNATHEWPDKKPYAYHMLRNGLWRWLWRTTGSAAPAQWSRPPGTIAPAPAATATQRGSRTQHSAVSSLASAALWGHGGHITLLTRMPCIISSDIPASPHASASASCHHHSDRSQASTEQRPAAAAASRADIRTNTPHTAHFAFFTSSLRHMYMYCTEKIHKQSHCPTLSHTHITASQH